MAKAKKITKKELENIVELTKSLDAVINSVGILEAQKHSQLHKIAGINEKIDIQKKELEEKYGSVNIDLKTGEYSEVEKEQK
jgi:hypothetical protein